MAKQKYPHIFLKDSPIINDYRSSGWGSKLKIPERNRKSHGEKLKGILNKIWDEIENNNKKRKAVSLPVKNGIYIEFIGKESYDLITKSLENIKSGIKLLNIHQEESGINKIIKATVYIPNKQRNYFLKKVDAYLKKETKNGKPANQSLIESIQDIRLAVLESFWQDSRNLLPEENLEWIEFWLSHDDLQKVEIFKNLLKNLHIEYKENEVLFFPERTVLIVSANRQKLDELIQCSPDIAEIRLAKETAFYWMKLTNEDQINWVEDLKKRLTINENSEVSVCILDTGINRGHELIKPLLNETHMDSWNKEWGTDDRNGHGTSMAGLIVYGDLEKALKSKNPVEITHIIESVKILPPKGENPKHLYGTITIDSISRAEINAPSRKRIVCLATTTTDSRDRGRPSSWSGTLDDLAAGSQDNQKRLIIVSAGNANIEQNNSFFYKYPENNLTDSIHDPSQAWNAVTVGAYTEKTNLIDPDYSEYKPLAAKDSLSPFSTTSLTWENKWPIKPDILMEGGNLGIDKKNHITECDDLSILTTCYKPTIRQFTVINQTSAAAAKAAWFAAQIAFRYPQAWPETIRALLIHSADWTDEMQEQFLTGEGKRDWGNLLRICGYGVPSFSKATECMQNSLTLIIEQSLQPFIKVGSVYKTKDMHIHLLPWPENELLDLGEVGVRLKVTLSYFIEPGPGEVGWKDKYRYASHGLRFEAKKSLEDLPAFTKRINKLAREEEDKGHQFSSDRKWILGVKNRTSGSIHSDIWEGTAAELATCNVIAVFPVTGWWKERFHLKKWNKKARYSLIVSVYTPEIGVDIYTPVATKVKVPVEIKR